MEEKKIQTLIRRYITGEATERELAELEAYIIKDENEEQITYAMEVVLAETGAQEPYDPQRFDPLLKNILDADKLHTPAPVKRMYPMRWAAAAAIILMVSLGSYFYFNKDNLQQSQGDRIVLGDKTHDIAPGKQGAVLTLASGKTIILDTAHNGKLLDNFTKTDESILVESSAMEYATLTTPRARTQALTLSDGSKVWLNAESSIKFPTAFTGKERNVEITGEAYFEVAHNTAMPFIVNILPAAGGAGGGHVEVLGTHFNINAYDDENVIKTTLMEGSVKVSSGGTGSFKIIKPGQQALLKENEIKVQTVNVDETIAWKNGKFLFDASMETIMKEIARWYDAEIVFTDKVPGNFVADISRDVPVSKLLHMLELTNRVHFTVEGKKVIVKK